MPKRALIAVLPNAVREELNRRLIDNGFSSYVEIAAWLKSLGHDIGKSSVHRYGVKLERKLQSWTVPATATTRIDEAVKSETTRAQQARVRADTGVLVLIIDPPTRETYLYATAVGLARARELVEEALFINSKRVR